MKKLILIIATTILLFACKNNSQPSDSALFAKASKYIEGRFNRNPDKFTVKCNKFDTLISLSTRRVAFLKEKSLRDERHRVSETYKKLKTIGSNPSKETIKYAKKALKLNDSLISLMKRNNLLDSTDVAAYVIVVTSESTQTKTGAKTKNVKSTVYLDKEFDVDKSLNDL
jgi:hypothetical protein